jgi:glycogen phosphorylase/synthase
MKNPRYLFEVSWEVCNMVGGIHTVLASKAQKMQQYYGSRYIAVGPDIPGNSEALKSVFREEIWSTEFVESVAGSNVPFRMGRWLIPGEPQVLLVNFSGLFQNRDKILAEYWERYKLHSLYGGWDYLEPVFFGQASGMVIENLFKKFIQPKNERVIVQCHEWMTSAALLYLQKAAPEVASVFTTHATVLGRALSANQKNPEEITNVTPTRLEQLAHEVGVSAKHSIETIAAKVSDCFRLSVKLRPKNVSICSTENRTCSCQTRWEKDFRNLISRNLRRLRTHVRVSSISRR